MRVVSVTPYALWPNGTGKGMPSYYYFHKGLEKSEIKAEILHVLLNSKDVVDDDCELPRKIWRILPIKYSPYLKPLFILIYTIISINKVRSHLKTIDEDVVLVGHTHLGALIVKFVKRKGDRVVGRFYGSLIAGKLGFDKTMSITWHNRIFEFFNSFDEFFALQLTYDAIIATNDGSALNKAIRQTHNVHFLLNGTSSGIGARITKNDGIIRLGIGGRCIAWKNINRHIEFLEHLAHTVSEKRFLVSCLFLVGHGEKEAYEGYRKRLLELDSRSNFQVELYSNLPTDEVIPILNKLDFWLSFQDFLNISNFVIETRQHGIPSIVLDFGSTRSFFDTEDLMKYCLEFDGQWMDKAVGLILDNHGTSIKSNVMSVEERQNLDLGVLKSII